MPAQSFHTDLERVLGRIIEEFLHYMHQTGLSRPQIHALLHIYHAGECQISEIGGLTDSTAPAASQLVDRLVQQGLLQRNEDPQDRRVKKLRLTDKGLELFHRGIISNQTLAGLMAALTPQQRETVHTAFRYLAEASHQLQASHQPAKASHA
jgi:DNA-binding MarR family transcriptional regulator